MAPLRLWEQVPGLGQALAGRCKGSCRCEAGRAAPAVRPGTQAALGGTGVLVHGRDLRLRAARQG